MTAPLGPDLDLQAAMVAVLKSDGDLRQLIGNPIRLEQDVPPKPIYPYVTIGLSQVIPDVAECIDGSEVFPTLHIWSRAKGWEEAKRIAAVLWAALNDTEFTLTENRCVLFERDSLGDQAGEMTDGVTKHIICHYRALTEPL